MEFRLLGAVHARVGGRRVSLGVRQQRFVLAVLALDVNRLVPVERLVDLVWPDDPPLSARGVIASQVSRLRATLTKAGAGEHNIGLRGQGPGYVLECDPMRVDVHRFTALLARARDTDDDRTRLAVLDEALALWQGPVLADTARDHTRDLLCGHLDEARLSAVEDRFDAQLRLGEHTTVISEATQLAAEHPQRHRLTAQLMLALHRGARTPEALTIYHDTKQRLADELGIDPPAQLQQLELAILRNDPDLTSPTPTPARDHRAPRQQPVVGGMFSMRADIATFTGRHDELRHLLDTVATAIDDLVKAIAIHAVDGMPGVGKTVFSVHAAHHLSDRFPDGHLFVELHGHTPGHTPVPPVEALHSLLLDAGLDPKAIPPKLDDRVRAWRTQMAGRKILLVLDDATDHHQIRPLIPGTPGSLVLITSRHRLPALDGVQPLTLDVLPPDQAVQMLLRIAGLEPHRHDDIAVADIVARCGYLPLAIALAAARLRSHPRWTARYLADLLTQAQERLEHLRADDRSVAAAFDTSFDHLPPERQHLVRLLGVHPGPEIDAYAVAALSDTNLSDARGHLDALHADHLIQETAPGRFQLHDLLRAYATTLAADLDPEDRDHALDQVLNYYLHTATTATAHLPRYTTPLTPPTSTPAPTHTPRLDTAADAHTWLTTELPTLTACITHTTTSAHQIPQLATTLQPFLRLNGYFDQALTIHHTALTAATHLNDHQGQATALTNLGVVQQLRDEYEVAAQSATRAYDLFTVVGDRLGQANALINLGRVQYLRGDYEVAAQNLTRAYDLLTVVGDRLGQANALINLGRVQYLRGDYEVAAQNQTRAYDLLTVVGDRLGQATALINLGRVQYLRGEFEVAAQNQTRAYDVYTEVGDRFGQATALTDLGRVQYLRGEFEVAAQNLTRAYDLYTELGSRLGQANALTNLGAVQQLQGDYEPAAQSQIRAYDLFTEVGDREGEAEALNKLADLALDHPAAGDPHRYFSQALTIARDIGTGAHEAHALAGQAHCLIQANKNNEAIPLLRQAHQLYHNLGSPEAHHIEKTLTTLQNGNDNPHKPTTHNQ